MQKLGRITVDKSENGCGNRDSNPRFAPEKLEKRAQNSTTEHDFFSKRSQDSYGHIA